MFVHQLPFKKQKIEFPSILRILKERVNNKGIFKKKLFVVFARKSSIYEFRKIKNVYDDFNFLGNSGFLLILRKSPENLKKEIDSFSYLVDKNGFLQSVFYPSNYCSDIYIYVNNKFYQRMTIIYFLMNEGKIIGDLTFKKKKYVDKCILKTFRFVDVNDKEGKITKIVKGKGIIVFTDGFCDTCPSYEIIKVIERQYENKKNVILCFSSNQSANDLSNYKYVYGLNTRILSILNENIVSLSRKLNVPPTKFIGVSFDQNQNVLKISFFNQANCLEFENFLKENSK